MKRLFEWFRTRRSSGKLETPQKPVEKKSGKPDAVEAKGGGGLIRDLFGDDNDLGYC